MKLQFEPLGVQHDRAAFSCGVQSLDEYMHTHAGQDSRRGVTVCYVLSESGSARIVGYYTLGATSVRLADLPPALSRGLPRYPDVPAALLGRLAVDRDFQRRGMGALLLMDAVKRVSQSAMQFGMGGLLVDAEREAVVPFYERYEFERLGQNSMRCFLRLGKAQSAFPVTVQTRDLAVVHSLAQYWERARVRAGSRVPARGRDTPQNP